MNVILDEKTDSICIEGETLPLFSFSCRFVYSWGPFIVKVSGPLGQNHSEFWAWRYLPDRFRKYFAEILDFGTMPCGRTYLVQEKHVFRRPRNYEEATKLFPPDLLRFVLKNFGDVLDNLSNFGFRLDNGEPIIFDYGIPNNPITEALTAD